MAGKIAVAKPGCVCQGDGMGQKVTNETGLAGATGQSAGLLLAISGFALLAVGDVVIKSIAGAWPGSAVAALRYMIGAAGLGLLLWRMEGCAGFRTDTLWLHIGRGAAVAVATLSFFAAIFLMPLAEATVIQFTNPMITALLSALFLGEKADRKTWFATAIAFAGVLIVLRPNLAELGPAALLPVLAAFGMAVLMILNRLAAGGGSILQAQFMVAAWAAPILCVATLLLHLFGPQSYAVSLPEGTVIARCALVAVTASFSHMLIYRATMSTPAALTAPAVYVQLIVALAAGWLLFDDVPDGLALAGSALIIAAGLYLIRARS